MHVLISCGCNTSCTGQFSVTIRVLCAQLDADAQDTAMGAPIILLLRLQTNNIAVM